LQRHKVTERRLTRTHHPQPLPHDVTVPAPNRCARTTGDVAIPRRRPGSRTCGSKDTRPEHGMPVQHEGGHGAFSTLLATAASMSAEPSARSTSVNVQQCSPTTARRSQAGCD